MSIRYNDLLKVQGVFTLFAALSLVWTFSFDVSIGRVISYVELLALLFTGSNFEYTEFEIKKVKMALAWSSRLTAIVMLRYAVYVNGRLRLMGAIKEDPNYLCAYFAFGVIFALQKVVDKKENWNKIRNLLIDANGHLFLLDYGISIIKKKGNRVDYIARPGTFFEEKDKKRIYDDAYSFVKMVEKMEISPEYVSIDEFCAIKNRIGQYYNIVDINTNK